MLENTVKARNKQMDLEKFTSYLKGPAKFVDE